MRLPTGFDDYLDPYTPPESQYAANLGYGQYGLPQSTRRRPGINPRRTSSPGLGLSKPSPADLLPDPFAGIRGALGMPRRSFSSGPQEYVSPEDKEPMLKRLGMGALSGLGAIGSFLDKYTGSRAFRGALGGKPRELLSVIPMSDKLGITDPADITWFKEITGWDDPNSIWDNVVNTALDIVADPTLPLTGFLKGGLSAAGKGLQKAGALKEVDAALQMARAAEGLKPTKLLSRKGTTLAEGLDLLEPVRGAQVRRKLGELAADPNTLGRWMQQPIGKSLDIGIPFTRARAGINVPLIDRARDAAFGALRRSPLGVTTLRYLSAPTKGMNHWISQDLASLVTHKGTYEGNELLGKVLYHAKEMIDSGTFHDPAEIGKLFKALEFGGQNLPQGTKELVDAMQAFLTKAGVDRQALALGMDLADPTIMFYTPRKAIMESAEHSGGGRLYQELAAGGVDPKRSEALKGVVGGTEQLMKIFMDKDWKQLKQLGPQKVNNQAFSLPQVIAAELSRKYGSVLPGHTPEMLEELGKIIAGTPDDILKQGFYANPLEAFAAYARKHADKVNTARAQIDLVAYAPAARVKGPMAKFADLFHSRKQGGQWVADTRMKPYNPSDPLSGGAYVEYIKKHGTTAHKNQLEQFRLQEKAALQANDLQALKAVRDDAAKYLDDTIGNLPVPERILQDLVHWDNVLTDTKLMKDFRSWWDSYTNLFKAGVLTRPARYTRDLLSGQAMNMFMNQWSIRGARHAEQLLRTGRIADPKRYLKGVVPDAELARLTVEEANRRLQTHIAAMNLIGSHRAPMSQIGNVAGPGTVEQTLGSGIMQPENALRAMGKEIRQIGSTPRQSLNPFNIRGVGFLQEARTDTLFAPVRMGDIAGNWTDGMNRLVPYLTLRERGWDAAEAARRVMESQVDYAGKSYTAFEKNILQKYLLPFYKFSKGMVPFVFREVMDAPAGPMSQAIRRAGSLAPMDQFLPEHVRQTMAVPLHGPLGTKAEGMQRYLTGLGLMHEDVAGLIRPGQTSYDTLSGTAAEGIGRLHPVLKGLMELAFQKQAYTGREMKDLDPQLARIASNWYETVTGQKVDPPQVSRLLDALVTNSPLAAMLTAARTAGDPRKGMGAKALNLLTGAKVTDIDVEKSRSMAIREQLDDLLRGQRGVRSLRPHLYVRREDAHLLDPEMVPWINLYRQQGQQDIQAARKRRATQRRPE